MFTGISGSKTVLIASITAVSVIFGGISPSGVQAPWVWLISFTACLPRAVQRRDQRVPRQRRAFHPGRIFVNPRQRFKPFQRTIECRIMLRELASAHEISKSFEQCAGIALATALHRFGHQIGGGDTDCATSCFEAGFSDRAIRVEFDENFYPVAAHWD